MAFKKPVPIQEVAARLGYAKPDPVYALLNSRQMDVSPDVVGDLAQALVADPFNVQVRHVAVLVTHDQGDGALVAGLVRARSERPPERVEVAAAPVGIRLAAEAPELHPQRVLV